MIMTDDAAIKAAALNINVERDKDNPLLLPLYGACGCVHPDIVYFSGGEKGYTHWLYYTPYPPQDKELPVLVRSNDGIRFTDRGVNNPLMKPGLWGWDSEYFADQDVLCLAPGCWIMYYAGNRKIQQIGTAFSADGITWTKYGRNPVISRSKWEKATGLTVEKNIRCPAAFWDESQQKIFLYFTARHDGIEEVFMATSRDGREHDICPQPVVRVGSKGDFDAGALHHIDVVRHNGMSFLLYVGSPRRDDPGAPYALGMALSSDGMTWHKIIQNPFMRPETPYEAGRLYRPTMCFSDNSTARLYYSVNDHAADVRHIAAAKLHFSGWEGGVG